MGKFAGFSKVKLTKPQRSTFDLTHDRRMTVRMGDLVPCLVTECVPSDSFNGSSEMLVRLAPLLAPIYDQINVYVHFFFVPNRLLWEDWEDFITGGNFVDFTPDPATTPVPPFVDLEALFTLNPQVFEKNNLPDYLGVPILPLPGEAAPDYADIPLDMMPFAAYQLIWDNYYRDRNFVNDGTFTIPMPSGAMAAADADAMMSNQVRAYSHDYFTSALPWTQRGADVLIPLDGSVTYLQQSRVVNSTGGALITNNDLVLSPQDAPLFPPGSLGVQNAPNTDGSAVRIENIDSISNATTTISDFRSAYALQVWLERNAIGGSRYTESTQAHFGVRPQDSRLNRPEYIGGGRVPVKISEVVSTAFSVDSEDNVIPQANMAGHGVTYGTTNQFKYFCTEHGFIMGILSVMAPASYHQGMPRMFFKRRSFLDYPWPTFAKLGEQTVDSAEIYASSETLPTVPDGGFDAPLFGYQSRYADWKYIPNTNHGDYHDTLLFWTLTRDFTTEPVLSNEFVLFNTSVADRIFAAGLASGANFWIYCHNRMYVKRPLPYFGTPNTLGFV